MPPPKRNVVVLDQNAGGKVDAVIRSSTAQHGVFLQSAQTGNRFAGVEHVGACSLNRVGVLARQRGDAAQVLEEVEDYPLAAQQHARIVANHGQHLTGMNAHAVEYLRMADHFKARVRLRARVEPRKNLQKARNGAQPGHHQLFAGENGARGAQVGVDDQIGRGVARGLVLLQGLLQQCVDAVASPVHKSSGP